MKHETVEKIATRVEIPHVASLHPPSPSARAAHPAGPWWLALILALGWGALRPALAQTSSVLQAAQVVAGGETRPPATSLQPASAITIEAWVSTPTAVSNYPAFVSYGLDTTPFESYVLQAQTIDGAHPADFWFLTGTGTHHQLFGTTHLAAGTQYYLAATYDGTTAKLYVNGAQEASAAVSGALYYPGGGLGLGRNYNRPADNFTGTVKGAGLYSTALTAAQISAHYTAGPPSPVFSLSQVTTPTTQAGSSTLQPASAFTLSAWINSPATLTNYPAFISYGLDTTPFESYILQAQDIDGAHPADVYFLTGSGTSHQLRGTTHLQTGTQYFLTATYNGTTATIYVNGASENTLAASGTLYYPGGGLGLARKYSDPNANFTGTERGVAIYAAALPADRIAAQFQAGSPPTVPGSFMATAASGTQINLSWTASSDVVGVTGYLIERCQGAGCTNFGQIANGTATSYSDTGLTASTSYTYRVRAVNSGNNVGDYSATSTAVTTGGGGDTTPPSTPTSPSATAISASQINLSWTASTDNVGVTGYKVERCQGSGCSNFAQVGTPTGTTFSDTGLTASTSYSYRVRATDAAGNLSGYSTTASATTSSSGDTTPPSAPTGLSASPGGSAVQLSWTASADNVGVTGYRIERCQGSGCSNFAQIGTSSGPSYTDLGLTPSTSYGYRVRATDAAGNLSGYSNTATTTTTTTLTAPTGLIVLAAASSEIDLAWSASSGGSGTISYLLESCSPTGCSNFAQIGAPTVTSYNNPGLTPGTSYSYRVRATDSLGDLSGYSSTLTYTTPAATPDCK